MARRKQIGRRVEGWKAKSWFKVYAPEVFDKAYLGDTVANEPEKVYGRVMQTTLGEISQDYSKQNIKMRFKITNVAGDAAYTDFVGHEVTKDYLRAMVKRRASRIDSILLLTTSDGKKLRVTATCFTINRADASQQHAIRKELTEYLIAKSKEQTYYQFVKDMVSGEISRDVFKNIKKIHPARRVELIKSKAIEASASTD
ncbi:MAG: 30S ribosomal protein S3ae [Methanomicrobium sp.]|uniref:30S ribosomal protein S3ae n=1 Tax=Methanomicrobium mobile TaxID=2205 RepID=UPI0005B2DCA8|nr:30S ribosomal protein S3ae [Methanomicrobium mobile]MBP5083697.1 30S ribosomal protein S3ae [Methanomicrobium sp.]MBP5474934.1 30S ribosomal protein S3ae [Methanomicrobium sp.]MBQ3718112.1 30S ribosomal protein S3ae [Methanomicrobium sp.]